MSSEFHFKQATTAKNDQYLGLEGEVLVDNELKQLRLHDGEKQGGYVIGHETQSMVDHFNTFQAPELLQPEPMTGSIKIWKERSNTQRAIPECHVNDVVRVIKPGVDARGHYYLTRDGKLRWVHRDEDNVYLFNHGLYLNASDVVWASEPQLYSPSRFRVKHRSAHFLGMNTDKRLFAVTDGAYKRYQSLIELNERYKKIISVYHRYGSRTEVLLAITENNDLVSLTSYLNGNGLKDGIPNGLNNVRDIAGIKDQRVAIKSTGEAVSFDKYGDYLRQPTDLPTNLTQVVMSRRRGVSGFKAHCLTEEGGVVGWVVAVDKRRQELRTWDGVERPWSEPAIKFEYYISSEFVIPTDALSGVVAIASSPCYDVALKNTGELVVWNDNALGSDYCQYSIPRGPHANITGIQALENELIAYFSD